MLVDVRKNNEDFVDRVLMKYIEYTMPIFTVNEMLVHQKTLGGGANNELIIRSKSKTRYSRLYESRWAPTKARRRR